MAMKYLEEKDENWKKRLDEEQDRLRREFGTSGKTVRLCARCDHAVAILYRGAHGAEEIKCPKCGYKNFFTPLQFRTA